MISPAARLSTAWKMLPTVTVLCVLPLLMTFGLVGQTTASEQEEGNPISPALTTVFVVRHAERTEQGEDPELIAEGRRRAKKLAHVLGQAGVQAIYVTPTLRTQQTAEPLAKALKLEPINTPAAAKLADTIRTQHAGQTVLVVGHSNTIPGIIEALGGGARQGLNLRYDDMFLLEIVPKEKTKLLRLKYGDPDS